MFAAYPCIKTHACEKKIPVVLGPWGPPYMAPPWGPPYGPPWGPHMGPPGGPGGRPGIRAAPPGPAPPPFKEQNFRKSILWNNYMDPRQSPNLELSGMGTCFKGKRPFKVPKCSKNFDFGFFVIFSAAKRRTRLGLSQPTDLELPDVSIDVVWCQGSKQKQKN